MILNFEWLSEYFPNLPPQFPRLGTPLTLSFCDFHVLGVSYQALSGISLGFGITVEDKSSEIPRSPFSF